MKVLNTQAIRDSWVKTQTALRISVGHGNEHNHLSSPLNRYYEVPLFFYAGG